MSCIKCQMTDIKEIRTSRCSMKAKNSAGTSLEFPGSHSCSEISYVESYWPLFARLIYAFIK